jgi:hypothetical protein|tara:strand:- start:292 stop:567 length:276 start_codon:yes stop_codon:yes gene_type:complete
MKKRDSRGRLRDYKKEYDRDHKPDKDKKDRASRNAARKKVSDWYKAHGKKLSSKKDVDHKDRNPRNNGSGNLRTMDRGANRAKSNRDRAKK